MGAAVTEEKEPPAGGKEEKLGGGEKSDGGERKKEVVVDSSPGETRVSRLQTQRPVAPIHVASHPAATAATASAGNQPAPTPPQVVSLASLNSRVYTNRISLLLFVFHLLVAAAAVCFFCYKGIQGLLDFGSPRARRERHVLKFWIPPIEGASVLSIILAFVWQKTVRLYPTVMVHIILWASFFATMAAGILLLCFSLPATDGLGVALIAFSIGAGLYTCWVTRRVAFTGKIFTQALRPVSKFPDVNGPAYLMMGVGFLWILVWCFSIIGALNFYYPPLTILALVLSLAWTAEVMRNVANLTVSRVIALYYLRGMQSNTQFSFQRATTINLGSACLGSLFVPSIEALRIIARGLNLLEGEDEFLFSCAHCCLRVMESIFRYGNSWAFVHIAAYGKGFVEASMSTWGLFERNKMEELVDSDITSAVCFLTGVTSGALSLIFAASWTFSSHKRYTATVSLLAFFVGYLMVNADRHGAAARLRGVLLRLLRREPDVAPVRLDHPGAAEPDRPRGQRSHASVPPAPAYRLTPAAAQCLLLQTRRRAVEGWFDPAMRRVKRRPRPPRRRWKETHAKCLRICLNKKDTRAVLRGGRRGVVVVVT